MDRKQSQFTQTSTLLSSDYVPAFGQSTNKKISKADLFKQIKDETQIFIYQTIELLQAANLVADPDNPIYVMVEETGYEFYKITSLAPGVNDIELDNGTTATNQHVGYSAEPQTVAELRMVSKVNKTASTAGYYNAGDGGNGEYWLDSSDTTSADNGFTVIVAADGGRWKLQSVNGSYNSRQSGDTGDTTFIFGVEDVNLSTQVDDLTINDGGSISGGAGTSLSIYGGSFNTLSASNINGLLWLIVNTSDTDVNLVYASNGNAFTINRFTNASAKTYTVRPNSDHAVAIGAAFNLRNVGAGLLTIVAGSGVTINPPAGGTLTVAQNGSVTLICADVDEYDLIGQVVTA